MKKGSPPQALEFYGGDGEDRTPDLRIANAALSQLSYVPYEFQFYPGNAVRTMTRLFSASDTLLCNTPSDTFARTKWNK